MIIKIEKPCSKCKKIKEIGEFYSARGELDGHTFQCKECIREKRNALDNRGWFGGNRNIAMKRDNYSCVVCSISQEEHKKKYGYSLMVHHIDGNGSGKKIKDQNNNLDNLMTVCHACHSKLHSKKASSIIYKYKITGN